MELACLLASINDVVLHSITSHFLPLHSLVLALDFLVLFYSMHTVLETKRGCREETFY